jgi:hypothetical protein
MNDLTTVIISALMLALVMPISALVLYLVLVRHVSLSDDTPMHAAVLQVFDNEAERAAWHADHQRAIEARTERVLAAYNRLLQAELRCLDPVTADTFRRAMSLQGAAEDHVIAEHGSAALVAYPAETHPRHASRMALWRRRPPEAVQSGG